MASNGHNAETQPRRPPGVYFDFVSRPAPTLRRRSDIAGFVGAVYSDSVMKARRIEELDRVSTDAWLCNGLQDYYSAFGRDPAIGHLEDAVRGFFSNGGQTCFVAPILVERPKKKNDDSERPKIKLSFAHFKDPLEKLAAVDAVSLISVPDAVLPETEERPEIWQAMVLQAEQLGDRIALLDPPCHWAADKEWQETFPRSDSALAALYWPWLKIPSDTPDPGGGGYTRAVPPSGHIAGTIAQRDIARGVFAPPANMVIEGAVGVARELTPEQRADINDAGINVIVALPGRGIRAMGARTLSEKTHEYRWLNVRRLVTHLCEWIAEDTQWTVFEPHSEVLWRAIERLVRTILFDLWRRGGLVGATDDEAYFVHCDKTTNPREETEQGRVICLIGLRPAPPAEMITVRIGIAEGRVELLDREVSNG